MIWINRSRIVIFNEVARPKEFDRDTALQSAIGVFCEHGFEGTSTEALLRAMGISRQSMYDTFGDKRQLYLEALQHYNTAGVADLIDALGGASSPLGGLETALLGFASKPAANAALGCMGVGAICEFGGSDPKVTLLTETSGRSLLAALVRVIAEAKRAGEIGADVQVRPAAQFMASTIFGLKVSARGGASPETLRGIARMAMRSLR
jgi:TetR/AcrR family transcriptional regulator, transcriptional repressor for nem operon